MEGNGEGGGRVGGGGGRNGSEETQQKSESTRADRRLSIISGRFLSSNKAFGLRKTTRLEHRWEQIVGRVFRDRNADALSVESNSFFRAGDCSEMGTGDVQLGCRLCKFELAKI